MRPSAAIRRALRDQAGVAGGPFTDLGDPAFVPTSGSSRWAPEGIQLFAVKDDYMPSAADVRETGIFAFAGAVFYRDLANGGAPTTLTLDVQRYPPSLTQPRSGTNSYTYLRQHARDLLSRMYDAVFLDLLSDQADDYRGSNSADRIALRIGPLGPGMMPAYGALVCDRKYAAVVGLDLGDAYLSEQALVAGLTPAKLHHLKDGEFEVMADLRVVKSLRVGERTGLFSRSGVSPPPSDARYRAATCYAYLEKEFPSVTVDIVATRPRIAQLASATVDLLRRGGLVEAGNADLRRAMGGDVPVPEAARPLLHELLGAQSQSSVVLRYADMPRL